MVLRIGYNAIKIKLLSVFCSSTILYHEIAKYVPGNEARSLFEMQNFEVLGGAM